MKSQRSLAAWKHRWLACVLLALQVVRISSLGLQTPSFLPHHHWIHFNSVDFKKYIRRNLIEWCFVKHLTLMMTSTQVVETSVTTTDNSPSQDYTHPDDQTTLLHALICGGSILMKELVHLLSWKWLEWLELVCLP